VRWARLLRQTVLGVLGVVVLTLALTFLGGVIYGVFEELL
jgi:hypothetical protein